MEKFRKIIFEYILPLILIGTFFIPFIVLTTNQSETLENVDFYFLAPKDFLLMFPYNIIVVLYLICCVSFFVLGILKTNKIIQIFRRISIMVSFLIFVLTFFIVNMIHITIPSMILNTSIFVCFILEVLYEFMTRNLISK